MDLKAQENSCSLAPSSRCETICLYSRGKYFNPFWNW